MGLTKFPNGVSSFGVPIFGTGAGNVPVTLGNYWFVNSATGNNQPEFGKEKDRPFATIDYAIGKCSAYDVIIVAPGHAETISAVGGITADVIGITIVGLGTGLKRPTVTMDTAATTSVVVSAASVTIDNIIFTANYADIATCFTVSGKDCTIKNCSFLETATNMNFLSIVLTSTTDYAADGLSVLYNERISIDAAALAFVSILQACNRLKVIGNFDNQASAADVGHFIIMAAKVCLGAQIIGNILNLTGDNNAQTVGVFMTGSSTSSTGIVAYNLVGSLDTTTELFDTAGLDFQHFENYYTGTIATSGKLWPAVDGA
jgi:hypothetical protein